LKYLFTIAVLAETEQTAPHSSASVLYLGDLQYVSQSRHRLFLMTYLWISQFFRQIGQEKLKGSLLYTFKFILLLPLSY